MRHTAIYAGAGRDDFYDICQAPRGVSPRDRIAATTLFMFPSHDFLRLHMLRKYIATTPVRPVHANLNRFRVHSGPLWPFKAHSLRVSAAA